MESSTTSLESMTVRLAPVNRELFDEYVLVGKLGHGGMAEVYLALSQGPSGFRKLLVIKRLHQHLKDDRSMVQMFLDEARLAARLNHPHVVQTNKVGSFDDHHFLAMEYLDGQPLNRVLRRCQERNIRFPLPLIARVISDALDGMHYAHEAADYDGTPLKIVHRDISPHNLFLTYDGQVKVLDFGIAKTTIQEAQTRTGLIKGKFAYIAPEQAVGDTVDRRADIWSMGVTLWEALAGRRLFRGKGEVQILHAALNEPIPDVTTVASDVPPELSAIAMRALQRDPEKRYATALAMKEDLDEWLASQSKGSSRHALSALLRELYSDTIADQQRLIKECIDQVATGAFPTLREAAPTPSVSGEVPMPGTGSVSVAVPMPEQGGGDRRRLMAGAVILLAVIAAALLALLMGGGGAPEGAVATADDPSGLAAPPATPDPATPDPATPTSDPAPATGTTPPVGTTPAPTGGSTPAVTTPPVTTPAAVVAGEDEDEGSAGPTKRRRWRAPHSGGSGSSEPATTTTTTTTTTTADPTPPPPDPAPVAAAPGRLSLDTTPWAIVFLGSRRLGITPLSGVELPPGTHTLRLRNPERGIETTYRVTITSGQLTERRIALE